ncbi:MAG: SpoIIE family protein phosphatase [Desulfobacterales bacterium]|nr:SpoIIE family protein phosphatase [Desulfobacterales bacterium]
MTDIKFSIKTKLIIMTVSIVLIVICLLTFVIGFNSAKALKEESIRQLSSALSQSAELLLNFMEVREANLDIWASIPLVDAVFSDPALSAVFVPSLREHFSKIREKEPWLFNFILIYDDIMVYDDSDSFEFSSGIKSLLDLPSNKFLMINLNNFNKKIDKDVILIKFLHSKNESDSKSHIIVLMLDIDAINKVLFNNIAIGKNGFVSLIGRDIFGNIIMPKLVLSSEEKKHFSKIVTKWERTSNIQIEYKDDLVFIRSHFIKKYPMSILGIASLNDIYQPIIRLIYQCAFLGLIASIIGIICAVYFSTRLTDPILKLTRVIGLISSGDLMQRVHISQKDEIGELANAFNNMTTELQEKHISLQESEKKFRQLYENAVEGIFQISPDGRLISANPSMLKIIGEDTFFNKEIVEILYKKGEIAGFEIELTRKDDSKSWLLISGRTVYRTNNDIIYYEGSILDITEKKSKEAEEKRREIAEAINKKLMDSIRYAELIQKSLLPNMETVKKYLPDSFFIWMPRDIVGGDIFFTESFENGFIIAVIDCTGHGVPGAFLTMIATSSIKRITSEGCCDPSQILFRLNNIIKTTLHQDEGHAKSDDGLDAAICYFDKKEKKLTFAGAKLPLIYVKNDKIDYIKGDKCSIGYKTSHRTDEKFKFTNHLLQIDTETCFYMYTDGFVDQLGGNIGCAFGNNRFKSLIKENNRKDFSVQKEMFINSFNQYKRDNEIQDDVTVVGFRLYG